MIKEGSTYHLWYTGNDGMTLRIGHATSSDGINWTKDPANPVLDIGSPGAWDWLNVYGPSVVKVGAEYKLWYSGETLPAGLADRLCVVVRRQRLDAREDAHPGRVVGRL